MKRVIYLITGPQGSGKSTLAKDIFGVVIEHTDLLEKYPSMAPDVSIAFLIDHTYHTDHRNIVFVASDEKLVSILKEVAAEKKYNFLHIKLSKMDIKKPEVAASGS